MPTPEEKSRRRAILRTMREEQRRSTEEYLERMGNRRWYFVARIDDATCEVQVLNSDTSSRESRQYRVADGPLEVGGELVPVEVLEAGLGRTTFNGDFVNENGDSVSPWSGDVQVRPRGGAAGPAAGDEENEHSL